VSFKPELEDCYGRCGSDKIMAVHSSLLLLLMPMLKVLSSWQSHCKSSLGSFDECGLSAKWPPTLRPSQRLGLWVHL